VTDALMMLAARPVAVPGVLCWPVAPTGTLSTHAGVVRWPSSALTAASLAEAGAVADALICWWRD
jgi:hypothetical protein